MIIKNKLCSIALLSTAIILVLVSIAGVWPQTTPTITWSDPADIVYGTPFSNFQLDANASVPGTVSTPPAGTLLSVVRIKN